MTKPVSSIKPAIKVVEKNENWLVVEKPEEISVHNQEPEGDLLTRLSKELSVPISALHPVHRLDKETSGLILIALNPAAAKELQQEFEKNKVSKYYFAVVKGKILSDVIWDSSLSDKSEGRKNPQGISSDRKESKTKIHVLKSNQYFSLIECELMTGRQHQIRKHAALNRHTVIGDKRYGEPKFNSMIADRYRFSRMALHSAKLAFDFRGKNYSLSSEVPAEFETLFKI